MMCIPAEYRGPAHCVSLVPPYNSACDLSPTVTFPRVSTKLKHSADHGYMVPGTEATL